MIISRRRAVSMAAALFAGGVVTRRAWPQDAAAVLSEDQLLTLMMQESDQAWTPGGDSDRDPQSMGMLPSEWKNLAGGTSDWKWWDFDSQEKPQPVWADRSEAIDFVHTKDFPETAARSFELTDAILRLLAERNSFELMADGRATIIGLRGCKIAGDHPQTEWAKSHTLIESTPDHQTMNCLMGVWRRDTGDIRLFRASTVPEVAYMWMQFRRQSGCNLMPCGLYHYEVGIHPAGNPSSKHAQHGALLLRGAGYPNAVNKKENGKVVVLRTLDDLKFSSSQFYEVWDACHPGNNIHSAIYTEQGIKSYAGKFGSSLFSSAGCQVLAGDYVLTEDRGFTKTPRGPWGGFLSSLESSGELAAPGTRFQYMLLTGREAALAALERVQFERSYYRVRFGSSGPRAGRAQEMIGFKGASVDSQFGPGSFIRSLGYQRDTLGITESGVLTVSDA